MRRVVAADGVTLRLRAWEVDDAVGRVLIVHGIGEHGGRYPALAEALRRRQISSYAPDLRGHGLSDGTRGHAERFDVFLDDLRRVVAELPAAPATVLLGHSLGGLIALRAVQVGAVPDLSGAVLSAPALGLMHDPAWRRAAAALLSRVLPALPLPNGIDSCHLSRDPAEVAAYEADPLVHDRISPRLFTEMGRAMAHAAVDAGNVRVPVLLLVPGDDRIVDAAASVEVAKRFAGPVQVRALPGFFHEPFHEVEAGPLVVEVAGWIHDHLFLPN